MQSRFFSNLELLFGASIETIPCKDVSQFREILQERIPSGRPLYILAHKMSLSNGNSELATFADGNVHFAFVVHGVDLEQDRVLVTNNEHNFTGWLSLELLGARVEGERVFDIHGVEDCKKPTSDFIAGLLAKKIENNFRSFGFSYALKRVLQKMTQDKQFRHFKETPPIGTLCGPQGIRAFADRLPDYCKTHPDLIKRGAMAACYSTMAMVQERTLFINCLRELPCACGEKRQNLLDAWGRLANSWQVLGRLYVKLNMKESPDLISNIQSRLQRIAGEEKETLMLVQQFLEQEQYVLA